MTTIARLFPGHLWAMHPDYLAGLDARLATTERLMRAGMSPANRKDTAYNGGSVIEAEIDGDTATLDLIGTLVARAPWFAKAYLDAIDPGEFAAAIDALATDTRVSRLVIEADCCGGSVAGANDITAAIGRFQAAGKTVEVRVAGALASAALWAVCNADRITATSTSVIGSIGVYCVLMDSTAADAQAGFKNTLVSTGPLKGLGADGAVTEPEVVQRRGLMHGALALFKADLAAGRALDPAAVDALADGSVYLAADAVAKGLIDAVASPADEVDAPTGTATAPDPIPPELSEEAEASAKAPITLAAAAARKESVMDPSLQAALAALSESHPTHAAALVALATKKGTTVADLQALVAKATTDAQAATIADLTAKLTAETAAKAALQAKIDKAAGHAQVVDPGGDDATKNLRKVPMPADGRVSVADLADIKAGKAVLTFA